MITIFGKRISLDEIPTYGSLEFYSEIQQANVQVIRDGEKVFSRHCGIGRGCFWTEFEERS